MKGRPTRPRGSGPTRRPSTAASSRTGVLLGRKQHLNLRRLLLAPRSLLSRQARRVTVPGDIGAIGANPQASIDNAGPFNRPLAGAATRPAHRSFPSAISACFASSRSSSASSGSLSSDRFSSSIRSMSRGNRPWRRWGTTLALRHRRQGRNGCGTNAAGSTPRSYSPLISRARARRGLLVFLSMTASHPG